MGRSRVGLTTKIRACVDTNGLPVRLELTTGEAHDKRLVTKLLSDLKSGVMLLADRGYDADWIRAFAGEQGAWANIPPKRNRKDPISFSPYLYRARNWSSVSLTGSNIVGGLRPGTANSSRTTSPSSNWHQSEFGYALRKRNLYGSSCSSKNAARAMSHSFE